MILILTPLKVEFDGLCAALGPPSRATQIKDSPVHYYGTDLAMAVGGHGKAQFGVTTSFLIGELRPRLVVCAGACGALVSWLKPLDVVVAQSTVEHDFNLRFLRRPLPSFAGAVEPLERLRSLPGVHVGIVASGDEDVVDGDRARELHEKTGGAIAVAWEGAGGARACALHQTDYLELRVVTDHCSESSIRDFKNHVRAGMARIHAAVSVLRGDCKIQSGS